MKTSTCPRGPAFGPRAAIALLTFTLTLGLVTAGGCSSDGSSESDCDTLCSEAKTKNCALNTGPCGSFCAAAAKVAAEGKCTNSLDAYLACAGNGPICESTTRCAAHFDAASTCGDVYCFSHQDEPACKEIAAQAE